MLPHVDPVRNVVSVTAYNEVQWNGITVRLAELEALLERTRMVEREPELEFRPHLRAEYETSVEVIRVIRDSGVTKFGFVGNDKWVVGEQPED